MIKTKNRKEKTDLKKKFFLLLNVPFSNNLIKKTKQEVKRQ